MPRRVFMALALAQLLCAAAAVGDITSARLEIQGAGLRVETVAVTTGIDIPTTIQTSFAGRTNDDAPAVNGLLAVGDLTGPGIDVPIQLTATPGYRFHIPGLPRAGEYYLQNVRLMNGSEVIQHAAPSLAKITVADLLQTSLKVKQLTPDEIRARGIVVDARNYDVYQYTFTFLVNGETVEIPFHVIVDPRTHVVTPVREDIDSGLPNHATNVQPPRWSPPEVIPFEFPDAPSGDLPDPGTTPRDRTVRPSRPKIPAALVIPSSLATLHQFFAVVLSVTNGAPQGSTAKLEDVSATLKIKVPDALRVAKTTPAVAFGQPVPVVDPNTGVTVLLAQAKGEAEWTLEGLKPGTHTVEVDLRATLREEAQEDVYLRATPSAAVIIHDPRFNITFSHPDTVRKGLEYSTFAFVTNMSPQTQTIRVGDALPQCSADQTPNVCRVSGGPPPSDMTLAPGEMRVVEYRLRAGETGQIFATAGSIDGDAVTASVQLHMGVSASGIPLSPATLVLPYYAQFVSPELVSAQLELFGLAYSLATAPLNQVTARFPRVIRTDVFYRANDIARAGQRIFIADAKRDAISNLLLDLLGNGLELREWDDLRRSETAGHRAGAALFKELRDNAQTSMSATVDDFASKTAHRGNYVFALAHATQRVNVALRGISGRTTSNNTLPFADVADFDAFNRLGTLAVAGRWTEDLEVVLTPTATGPIELELLFPGPTTGTTMRAHLDLQGTANEPLRVPITNASATQVQPQPLTILGARQDLHLDAEGHKVSILFSRPITPTDLLPEVAAAIDFNRDGVAFTDARPIFAAALQQDQRVANLSFDHVLSTNASYTIDVAPLIDPTTNTAVSFTRVVPRIDNDRPAGIVYGRFLTGDNKAIPNAEIRLFSGHFAGCRSGEEGIACNPFREAAQYARTRADGSFLFEYVPRDVIADSELTGAYKAVGVTPEGKATVVEGAVRLPARVHLVNLQLLGRGSAEGKVKYDNGEPAAGVRVHVSSTMFNTGRDATTDATGAFRVDDLAVGPITFGAVDDAGNTAFASGEIATPGQVAVKELVLYRKPFPGTGAVYGRVTRSDTGAPVLGARVGVYSQGYGFAEAQTDSEGRFEFSKVPSGFVTLLAAEWSVSRENAAADFDLRADETKEVNLSLSVTPADMKFVRMTGRVLRENPLYPGDSSKYERVAGAVVNLAILTTTADANGEFAFDGVPIIATGKTIRAYDPSTKRFATTTVPTLTEAGPNDVTVFIPASSYGGGTIRVRVVSAGGIAVDGFRVIEPGFPPITLTRIGAGLYEYRDAPVGHPISIYAVDGPPAYGEQVAAGTIRLDFAGQTATLILRLPGQGTVRAKLRSDFDLIGDVSLTYPVWSDAEQTMESFTAVKSTSENGIAGFATFTSVPALETYTVASTHPVYGYAEETGQLAYEGDLTLHTLQLSKLSTVRGTVYAIDGITPVAKAAVRLIDGRRDAGIVHSQPDGTFVFYDVPAAVSFTVTAEVTQSGIYRTGIAFGRTPDLGGPAPETAAILRRRGSVEGRVVYAGYKVYDPGHPANNVADDTPSDFSDNAPVPLARFTFRELDYPARNFGSNAEPLTADVGGRFALNNIFIGPLRASAWASDNQELRGDWTGTLTDEGQLLTPVYIAIGGGGTGSLQVKVVDPNQQYLPIANAEVRLYRGGLFDLATTDDAGIARFDQLPAGSYGADAYSKSLGKSGAGAAFTITRDQLTELRILLEFVGKVDGRLTDPMFTPAKPLPGVAVKLTASSFYAISSTDAAGLFFFEGIREGTFVLEAKDTQSNRWAKGEGTITPANRRPYIELALEKTDSLHVAVYLPNDTGGNSGTLAGAFDVDVTQRCAGGCEYHRTLQGNQLVFPSLFINGRYGGAEPYAITLKEIGGAGRTLIAGGAFPNGNAANPLQLVYPAFGSAEVTVMQAGAPAAGARVEMTAGEERRSLYTDASGKATATGLPLGNVFVQVTSVDGRFSGATTLTIARQSVPGAALIELGAYAGVSGTVEAEAGGPSIGTRVVISFANRTLEMLTGSEGEYLFQGIPTSSGGTNVSLTFVGPDGVTIGARRTVSITNDWASRIRPLGNVKLDATTPQLVSITPADGSQNVSPDAPVRLVFSEPIEPADLNAGNLQLIAADGSGQVACTITSAASTVTLTPILQSGERFPLRSNTLYRIVVQSALRDLTGHTLPAPRGSTFTTSDYAEPRVVKVTPSDKLPLPAQVTLQFHFNEPVAPTGFDFHFYKLASFNGAVIAEKSGNAHIDPVSAFYFAFAPAQEIEPQSFYRAVLSGIRDPQGNPLGTQTFNFFSYDSSKPYLRLLSPVPDGTTLVSGVQYTLNIDARSDSLDGPVATDLAQVEFVRTDIADATPVTVTTAPFAYRFAAPEAPEAGFTYSMRATATDLSGNAGPPSTISWTVKPNAAPKNVNVTLSAASAYPGATVTANVTFEDEGVLAPVQVVARGTNGDATEFVQSQTMEAKRDNVGQPWPAVALPFTLPFTLKPDTNATFTATVTDVRGLSASGTASVTILADTIKPLIVSTTPAAETRYNLNATYRVTATVSDAETGVSEVQFVIDGATYRAFTSIAGTFTSPPITATARNVDTRIPITVRAIDYNGNTATRAFDVIYVGVNDPTAPKGTWLCPVDRAVIPASQTAFKLPLKVRAQDDVSVTSVQFRVPGLAGLVTATRIAVTDDYEALVTIDTPAADTPFTIAALISDADATHTIELPIAIDVVAFDRIIDATEAVDADTVALYENESLLVRGAGRLFVNVPLTVRNLAILDGGKLETLGTTLTRERKLELTVTDRLYADCTSTIDVTGRGYLGGWGVNPDGTNTRSESSRGRTLSNALGATNAAASHAGFGGSNPNGATNATYGSIIEPVDLGSGGAGHPTDTSNFGGVGGGAVSLRASTASDAVAGIVLAGAIRADASWGRNGGSGGSIRVEARQLVVGPLAQLTANGGAAQSGCNEPNPCFGGSGGRIAVTASERLDLNGTLRASGGANGFGSTLPAGAAGTIYVRKPGQTNGELTIAQIDPIPVRATPLTNGTFDHLTAGPWALVRLDGPATFTAIEIDPTAVVVQPNAVPTITGSTTPANNASVIRNTPLEALLDLASTAGVMTAELDFSAAPPAKLSTFLFPKTVDDHRVTWTIPADAPLGAATLKVKVIDRADRVTETTLATFTVIDNTAPVINTFTALPASLYPGRTVTATIAATDDVAVTRVTATSTIGATPTTQTRTTNGKSINEVFTFTVPVDTPGGTPMTAEAAVEDAFPNRAATKQLANITILTDTLPPQATITAPADAQLFEEAAGSFAISVTASDSEVAVKTVTARIGDGANVPLTLSGATWTGTLTIPPIDGEDLVTFPITAIAADYAGNQKTATINIRVRPTIDPNAPTLQWTCGKDAKVPAGVSMKLRVEAIAANASNPVQKVEFVAGAQPALTATNISGNLWEATWNIPAGAATHTITAVATSSGGAERSIKTTITAVVADQLFTTNATITAADLSYENKVVAIIAGTLTISGPHTFADLLILGGTVTHPAADATLRITANTIYVACDAAIDATARGYSTGATHPAATNAGRLTGGSHLGVGGLYFAPGATTFGSVIRPQELGGAGSNDGGPGGAGGGALTLIAQTTRIDGAVRANGGSSEYAGGAGGSIWITAQTIAGSGSIEATGGASTYIGGGTPGGGGGGAIAVEYTDATSTLPSLRAAATNAIAIGGAGTIFIKAPASTYGNLIIDNTTRNGERTELPSLGTGIAQPGTAGTTLITDRTIPAYFVGHRIEIPGKGLWRITNINASTITLEVGANAAAGDSWHGVYLFDAITVKDGARVTSNDIVRAASLETLGTNELLSVIDATTSIIRGTTTASNVAATNLTIDTGATLKGSTLAVDAQTLLVKGTIDASGLGYAAGATYPSATAPGTMTAGSHLGIGGVASQPAASTFGSVYQPSEAGGGGDAVTGGGAGGGIVSINTQSLTVNGAIRANGAVSDAATGAGGSIRIKTQSLGGSGTIEANGGTSIYNGGSNPGGGGGGAVAIDYTTLVSVPTIRAVASTAKAIGGAGTLFIKGPTSTWGDLTVDNGNKSGQPTQLPSLGSGIAQPGTSGTTLVTDRATNIPAYFAGNFVDLEGKGTFRITAVSGKTLTLEAGANAATGDAWRGAYRFDTIKLRTSNLLSADLVRYTALDKDASSMLTMNAAAPQFPAALRSQIKVSGDAITGPAGAVTDTDTPIKLTATNTRTAQTFIANAALDGSFSVPIGGAIGDTFTLRANDSHALPMTSIIINVNGALAETATIDSLTLETQTVAGGTSVLATLRLTAPARAGGIAVAMTSSNAAATVPATVTVPAGSTWAQFTIATSSVATHASATITATLANAKSVTLTITPASAVLTSLTVSPSSVEGGASTNATVTLGAAAPPGGAVVLLNSDSPLVRVPSTTTVAEATTQSTFTITTPRVASTTTANLSASYGTTKTATVTLTACASMPTASKPSTALKSTWFDDAPPANATATGDATFDNTQSAAGTLALHFAASTTSRSWSFTNATPLTIAASDTLVLYALVNPCNPPRQIVAAWSDGTTERRASWGESRITTQSATYAGAITIDGAWTRLEVPATVAINATRFTLTVDGGEAWFDAAGTVNCVLTRQPAPPTLPQEIVWFDDALPAGAAVPELPFIWDTAQAASGTQSFLIPNGAGLHQRYFENATALPLASDDMIVVYLLIDPCNPPREVMLEFNDGSAWNRRAYWGENLIPLGNPIPTSLGGDVFTVSRRRLGPLPDAGRWVRLEVPVSSMEMTGVTLRGLSVVLYDGQAWVDRVGKAGRVNLALNKPAKQSSGDCVTTACPENANDGNLTNLSHTWADPEAWWEVDLGAVQPIDGIDVWNGGVNLCCQERLSRFWVLVSEEPFASTSLTATRNQAGVTGYYHPANAARPSGFEIARKGRYVRVQLSGTNYLHPAEIQVWAPLSASPVNLAGGRAATQSSTLSSDYGQHSAEWAVNGSSIGITMPVTDANLNSWWQVDLGSVQWISTVDVDNNWACCYPRMADSWIFVSDTPFTSNTVAGTLAQPGVAAYFRGGWFTAQTYAINRSGRYVRLQLNGTNYLHPTEVKVWSPFLTLPPMARTPKTE